MTPIRSWISGPEASFAHVSLELKCFHIFSLCSTEGLSELLVQACEPAPPEPLSGRAVIGCRLCERRHDERGPREWTRQLAVKSSLHNPIISSTKDESLTANM